MFGLRNRKNKFQKEPYDRDTQKPVIHTSICTGEQVAGFKDIQSGKFHEIMVIRDERDLQFFLQKYEVSREDISKEY